MSGLAPRSGGERTAKDTRLGHYSSAESPFQPALRRDAPHNCRTVKMTGSHRKDRTTRRSARMPAAQAAITVGNGGRPRIRLACPVQGEPGTGPAPRAQGVLALRLDNGYSRHDLCPRPADQAAAPGHGRLPSGRIGAPLVLARGPAGPPAVASSRLTPDYHHQPPCRLRTSTVAVFVLLVLLSPGADTVAVAM